MNCLKVYSWLIVVSLLFILGCSKGEDTKYPPLSLDKDSTCSVCGMTLLEFPGPKAQMIYTNGRYDFFCGTLDLFTFYLQPDSPKNIAAIYVNDMGKEDWSHPTGHWIDARTAFLVYGAEVRGAMGDILVPFSSQSQANDYISKYRGKLVSFNDVNMEMLRPFMTGHHKK
ncbi:nitrous oxide reductase accessory protein NosL [Candidatus Magnetomonas plexicatena]|uniref:nitrous oxide reductase accessory protein NosL n=1 Tax=Candidatus Magnetomonas plexicatena TaxID=2552947 RepID=UPI004032B074